MASLSMLEECIFSPPIERVTTPLSIVAIDAKSQKNVCLRSKPPLLWSGNERQIQRHFDNSSGIEIAQPTHIKAHKFSN